MKSENHKQTLIKSWCDPTKRWTRLNPKSTSVFIIALYFIFIISIQAKQIQNKSWLFQEALQSREIYTVEIKEGGREGAPFVIFWKGTLTWKSAQLSCSLEQTSFTCRRSFDVQRRQRALCIAHTRTLIHLVSLHQSEMNTFGLSATQFGLVSRCK